MMVLTPSCLRYSIFNGSILEQARIDSPGSLSNLEVSGILALVSITTRTGCLARGLPRSFLAVSSGSSAITVLIPVRIASDCDRIVCVYHLDLSLQF